MSGKDLPRSKSLLKSLKLGIAKPEKREQYLKSMQEPGAFLVSLMLRYPRKIINEFLGHGLVGEMHKFVNEKDEVQARILSKILRKS